MVRNNLLAALKIGAGIAAIAAAMPVQAQDNPPAQAAAGQAVESVDAAAAQDDGDIVVTARRRTESLVDVPIAVTAYSGAALENQGALDITDLADTTPNVTLEVSRGTNSTLSAFIRGVGQQDPVAGFEQGVGIYVDDVYLNRPQAAVLDIYDVERVEILRGPQGTLYGRNTTGGAVKYVTRRISNDPELHLKGNLGSYKQADGIVSASTPVGDGTLRYGAAAARLSRGGFGKKLTNRIENYNKDVWAGRVSAEVNNEDDIFIRVSADYTKDNSNPRGGHRLIPGQLSGAPVLDHVYDTRGGLNTPEQQVKSYGASLSFKPTPDHTLYASYSQGFKGGGFDPRGVGVNAPTDNANGIPSDAEVAAFLSFLPEQVDSYEIGYKGSLMDGALNVALAGFYAD
jgi:iron complex outermembrane receptor protein